MILVKVTNLKAGTKYDRESIQKYLEFGKFYTLNFVDMGRSHTDVFLNETGKQSFNSINLSFYEEDGTPINIYNDKRFNPFMTNVNNRPSEFYHRDHYQYLYELYEKEHK